MRVLVGGLWLCLLIAALCCLQRVEGQLQSCALNRIDVNPCSFRHTATTDMPEENEYGIYSTRILAGPTCSIRRRNHQVKDIQVLGGDPRLKFIFSPGFEIDDDPESYGNQMIVMYNVNCPPNHDAFFNITEIIMEEPNCPVEDERRCVDYVQVVPSGSFGRSESCGNDPGLNSELLIPGVFQVIFRTSSNRRFPGFKATVTCLDRSANTGRRKRSTDQVEYFETSLQNDKEYVQSFTDYYRQTGYLALYQRWYPWLFRIQTIIIQFEGSFTYANNRLTISPGPNQDMIESEQVFALKVLDPNSNFKIFKRSARDRKWKQIVFEGAGTLIVVGCNAFYKQFIVNPRGILPLTEEQRFLVYDLTTAFFEQSLENPDERLCDEVLNPTPFDLLNLPVNDIDDDNFTLPQCPRSTNIANRTCNYSDERLLMALDNIDSPNLLVSTVVDVLLSCTRREMPGRIEILLNSQLDASCTIMPEGTGGAPSFFVTCTSNRDTVRVIGCRTIEPRSGAAIPLDRFCRFPSFTFPVLETGIRPGVQELTLDLVDSTGLSTTEVVEFIAPFFVNCSSRSNLVPSVNITCVSNQIAERLTVRECLLDGTTPLRQCAFPMFMISTVELSRGRHTVGVVFNDRTFGDVELTVGFTVF
ncbi:uncharacterized protein LOC135337281 [Halichondria panicea]|uniref:uncharacterized protein LOC135337281 n=1 Tax=Halichondria panicea TaxID=6063 RepID=UPI00312B8681